MSHNCTNMWKITSAANALLDKLHGLWEFTMGNIELVCETRREFFEEQTVDLRSF